MEYRDYLCSGYYKELLNMAQGLLEFTKQVLMVFKQAHSIKGAIAQAQNL
jgi:hypothetical protein